jgi:hypothetical protein
MRTDLQEIFRQQARECRNLGSPFNALVCELLAERLDGSSRFGERVDTWVGPAQNDALALRAVGALHGLARSGRAPRLSALYPPYAPEEPAALWDSIAEALDLHSDFVCEYLERPPQTNEIARSSVLLGAALLIAQRTALPLSWNEIGASAGLNLAFDRYRYELGPATYGDSARPVTVRSAWEGNLPPLDAPFTVAERAGADLSPLHPESDAHRERLLSYIWPDQNERLERTQAALQLAASAPWAIERASAAEWVWTRFAEPLREGRTHVLAHTVVWHYLPEREREQVTLNMQAAGARATARSPVAWFSMEADGVSDGAALSLTLWPGGQRQLVGRADFHARWVRWF